jgi:hypothetical protein
MVKSVMQSISFVAIFLTANSLLRLMEYGVINLGWSVVSHRDRYQPYVVFDICERSLSDWFQRSLTTICGRRSTDIWRGPVFDQISFQVQIVSHVTEYKYLGLCIDSRLN